MGSDKKEEVIEQIVNLEWQQFQQVQNEGGRADCQDDPETFGIMRKSQFLAWTMAALESYLEDIREAEANHWNLLTEKYARMMESTAPKQYAELAKWMPVRSGERIQIQEEMIRMKLRWEEEFAEEYPNLAGRGRLLYTSQDTPWDTSLETYARGELGTYSDRTIRLLKEMYDRMEEKGENLTYRIMDYMVRFYGYQSLKQAEERHGK
ncbi:MAG: DUF4125 family protein [Eubacteriales bacterium]|nr:DUF4125 family protein [Eubacteriales bacterium]